MGHFRMLRLKNVVAFIVLSFFIICFSAPTGAQDAKPFPYEKDLLRFEKEDQATPPTNETTFFVGSSTFTIWKEIPEDFAEFHAVNRGFGGSQISQWLEVAADRILVPHAPNRIVFFCGCNDIAGGKTPEKTLEDFKAFVMKMRASNPRVIIHFCALHMPPVRKAHWENFRIFNASVKEIADKDPNIYYVDFAAATNDDQNGGSEELFQKDRLHLTREGEKKLIPIITESIRKEIVDNGRRKLTKIEENCNYPPSSRKNAFKNGDFKVQETVLTLSEPTTVSLGSSFFKADVKDEIVLLTLSQQGSSQPFAQTKIPRDQVCEVIQRIATENGDKPLVSVSVEVQLKSGWIATFSDAHSGKGFVAIDYRAPKNGLLTNEEPLVWELTSLDQGTPESYKAFGTAGLKPVDGHKGSYAFLAIVDPSSRSGIVGGWITSEKAGGVVRSGKSVSGSITMTPRLDYGRYMNNGRCLEERFVLGSFDDCRIGLENYADSIATYYSISLNTSALNGYCTWYSDKNGGACNENAVKELTKAIVEDFGNFGFKYVQIDDKWQLGASHNGPNKNFTSHNPKGPYPSGMKATSSFLNENSLVAGLWFMPFSGNFDDPYWADKQDLFVRSAIDYPEPGQKNTRRYSNINQKIGEPYETFWGGTSLDTSNPKTLEYITDVVTRITQDWNYKYIKIDGMWVGGAIEQLYVNDEYMPDDMGMQIFYDQSRTNVENFRTGLQCVRNAAKDTFILGCNVSQNMRTLAASYGLVDAMRVGPDNGASWDGVCAGPWRGTNRYFYNGRVWFNDPDPVYARVSIPLERAQVSATWASITGQLYALSDWIPDYDEARVDLVRKTIPNHLKTNVRPVDLFDEELARAWILTDDSTGTRRDVVALFNWHGDDGAPFEYTPEKLGLPLSETQGKKIEKYVAYDFWNDELLEPFDVLKTTLPKESCKVLAIRPVGEHPLLLSTSRHISQGIIDVLQEEWNEETKTLSIQVKIPPKFKYELRVYNPKSGKLDRWQAPDDCSGTYTVEYRLDEVGTPSFTIVK